MLEDVAKPRSRQIVALDRETGRMTNKTHKGHVNKKEHWQRKCEDDSRTVAMRCHKIFKCLMENRKREHISSASHLPVKGSRRAYELWFFEGVSKAMRCAQCFPICKAKVKPLAISYVKCAATEGYAFFFTQTGLANYIG